MPVNLSILFVLGLASSTFSIKVQKDPVLQCGGCLAILEELQDGIAKTDQKETLQVGSYRINPDGTQNLKQVKFATSELNIIELMENVCGKMTNYGKTTNEQGEASVIKTQSEPGMPMSLKNMEISGSIGKGVKSACEYVLEEYEEELIKILQDETDANKENTLCVELTGLCDSAAIDRKVNARAEALRLGLNEKLEKEQAMSEDDDEEWEEDDEEEYGDDDDEEEEDEEEDDLEDEEIIDLEHTEL